MLKLVINTISKELVRRKEVQFLEEQKRRKLAYAEEQKNSAIAAYRNEKHMIGKTYMQKYDTAIFESMELQDKINNLTKE